MSYQDRGAVFIGACAWPASGEGDPAVYFRRGFQVAHEVVSATR